MTIVNLVKQVNRCFMKEKRGQQWDLEKRKIKGVFYNLGRFKNIRDAINARKK